MRADGVVIVEDESETLAAAAPTRAAPRSMRGKSLRARAAGSPSRARATAPFLDLVITECQAQYGARDDVDFPKILILSQPAPFYEDRPTDHTALSAAIVEGLEHLERAGADFLAIACNTAHIYFPDLARSVGVPLLDMVALAVAEVPASTERLALIAARPTVEAGIYQQVLAGRELAVLESTCQPEVDHLLGALRTTPDPLILGRLWESLLARVEASRADAVLLACLDLSGIAAGQEAPRLPIVDSSRCLAREIVRFWLQLQR